MGYFRSLFGKVGKWGLIAFILFEISQLILGVTIVAPMILAGKELIEDATSKITER